MARRVADRVLVDFPRPPPFNWGEGVLMAGMMRAGAVLEEPRYVAFVRAWADHWRAAGIDRLLEGDEHAGLRRYCGQWGPGYALLLLYERTQDPAYLEIARQIADFLLTRAGRTREGGFTHYGDSKQLWVDTLYMSIPLLVHLARVDARPELLREAAHQMIVYSDRLQDDRTGLFYHMYDEPSGRLTDVLWGRGNGWVALSYVELLSEMEKGSGSFCRNGPKGAAHKMNLTPFPEFPRIDRDFRNQMAGLLAMQDDQTQLWHTVLDRQDSYLETSCSAMILCSLIRAERYGLLSKKGVRLHLPERPSGCFAQMKPDPFRLEKTWRGLAAKVDETGHVVGVSAGTITGRYEDYARKGVGTYTWGTGAFLLAASGLCEN